MKALSKLLFTILMIGIFSNIFALDKKYFSSVESVIKAFKSENKKVISALIEFPINRNKPLTPIIDKYEFLAKYDEVFDKELINIISNSKKEQDWSSVGWRGVMLGNGLIWLNNKGRITAINYETSTGKSVKEELLKKQKLMLHKSLRSFKKPILQWKTEKFHIRIDEVKNDKYRYTAWSLHKKTSDSPDIVLSSGVVEFEGSGGNHHYIFNNDKYKYICYVNKLGSKESPPGSLEVYKGEKLLLSEPVLEVL